MICMEIQIMAFEWDERTIALLCAGILTLFMMRKAYELYSNKKKRKKLKALIEKYNKLIRDKEFNEGVFDEEEYTRVCGEIQKLLARARINLEVYGVMCSKRDVCPSITSLIEEDTIDIFETSLCAYIPIGENGCEKIFRTMPTRLFL